MDYKYQLIILGQNELFEKNVLALFSKGINELGISDNNFQIIHEADFQQFKTNEPGYCICFGNVSSQNINTSVLDTLISNAIAILPVVENLENVCKVLPTVLHKINALEIKKECDCPKIVSKVLEGLSLLRKTRKIFISYKRDESSGIALQLFEVLEKHGFDVFLDTHSVPPAENFQEELFHRMADCDVVLMLYTTHFFSSKWTKEEFEKANSMSIGIMQLIWPKVKDDKSTNLFEPICLAISDFCDENLGKLKNDTLQKVVNSLESMRVRSLAARRSNIVTEFVKTANNLNHIFTLQANGMIVMDNFKGMKKVLVIPTVGIPASANYNYSRKFIESLEFSDVFLLYDHTYIIDKWLDYYSWLDKHLPIKTVKVAEVEGWLK